MIKSVLIADDDPVIRATLLTYLGSRGFRVMVAADSMQASMVSLRPPYPDVVVLDIRMPGGGGIQVLKRVRTSVKTAHIPIIAVSADTDPNLPLETKVAGANAFLPKPIDLEKLYLKICELLNMQPQSMQAK
jgi:CheY-like chemotaxis protein